MKSSFWIASAMAVVLASPLAATPVGAGGLLGAIGKSAAKRAGAASPAKPHDVIVSRARHPESAAHIEHAQRLGQPTVLTLDRAGATQRRQESLRHIKRKSWTAHDKDRDEYPFAMTREGGSNSSVRYVGASDNRSAGKSIGHQVRNVPDGERIRVLVRE